MIDRRTLIAAGVCAPLGLSGCTSNESSEGSEEEGDGGPSDRDSPFSSTVLAFVMLDSYSREKRTIEVELIIDGSVQIDQQYNVPSISAEAREFEGSTPPAVFMIPSHWDDPANRGILRAKLETENQWSEKTVNPSDFSDIPHSAWITIRSSSSIQFAEVENLHSRRSWLLRQGERDISE